MMGKWYNLLIGLLFIASSMYATTINDSIEVDTLKNIALNEVFVKAERGHIVKKKGNVKTFFFSHHANETKDIYVALTEVPDLRIDPTMKTISLAKGGTPLVLIDGIPKSHSLESISSSLIDKVEVSTIVPLEYMGQGYTGVVNIITKKHKNASKYFNIGVLSHPVLAFGSADANFSYDKNKFSLYTGLTGFAFLDNKSKATDALTTASKSQYTETERSSYYRDWKAMVGGDYRWTDKSVSSLGFVFEMIPQNSFDTGKIEYASENDLASNEMLDYHRKYDDDLCKYQMNLYHKSTLGNASSLTFHASAIYSYNANTTKRQEDATEYVYSAKYRQREVNGGIDYAFPWLAANWKIGVNAVFSWHNIHSLVDQAQSKYNECNNYGYLAVEKNIGNLNFSASSGINIAYRNMENEHFSFVNWHPIFDLAYHFGSNNNLELSYEYANSNPEIDQLCAVNSATNPLFVNIGNENIKPAYTHDLQLDYTTNIKSLYIDVFAQYKNIRQRIAQYSKMDKQQVVMSYYNDGNSYNLYNCGATVRYMVPHFVLLGMIEQNWVKCANYTDNYLYGMLQGQYYNDRFNVNLMFDTNEVTKSIPEARYKTSPESQLTLSYSVSKSIDICVGMRYLLTHKNVWNTMQTEQIQESYYNNFSTRQNLVMFGIRYNLNGQDKKNHSEQVFKSATSKSFIKDF